VTASQEPQDFAARKGVALVTGGTGGIGAAVVRMLAARGSKVAFTYRSNALEAERLLTDLADAGAEAVAYPVDLTDDTATGALPGRLLERFGAVHTVVYASGPHVPMVHLSAVTPAEFRAQLDADAGAFFSLVQPLLPALRDSRGSIVAVSTAATHRYPVRDGLSAGPKGAVDALVRAFAAEEGRFGVRVNAVGPGMLTDGMAERLIGSGQLDERALEAARGNIPLRRFGTAHDIAEAACFLASDRAGFISGQLLAIDGGYTT
jgi:NAD(P)-dependent dehydrogenase (short-subunit alcohol dehydrogenase family)